MPYPYHTGTAIPLGELDGECYGEKYFERWVHCATGPTDNRDCCKKANVTDPLCLELCDGTHPLNIKDPTAFYDCGWKFPTQIYRCDHAANKN
ncbi:hypothetical protein AAVH_18305 [Aphelenchoides avenae]|nr:hypothetical protein AAVH_18305 [Aphelenchus avenae]